MAESSTKVFILEVMGRHAGWIAGAAGLAQADGHVAPQLILFPERVFDPEDFLKAVDAIVARDGFCAIVASEGIKTADGQFLAETGLRDAFGHAQLGGVASTLAQLIKDRLGLKYHYAIADYLQRAARHIASQTDVDQAYALGAYAARLAEGGETAVMPIIKRTSDSPYQWELASVPLSEVANVERTMPDDFIRADGYGITDVARRYFQPLIQGEAVPPFHNGLPSYVRVEYTFAPKRLSAFSI